MEFELIKNILALSASNVWNDAKKEWEFFGIEIKHGSSCLCGKYPISECCYLRNTQNRNEVVVGNCCIKRFMGDNTKTKMFNAISKEKINAALIEYAFKKGIINDWENKFANDLWRKRTLTEKQKYFFDKIKKRIINEVLKNGNN